MADNDRIIRYVRVPMFIFIIFLCGIANFAMHKAMMDSDHPLIHDARASFAKYIGPWGSYILEFAMLAAAMIFANMGMVSAVIFYGVYTLANGAGALVLLSNKR